MKTYNIKDLRKFTPCYDPTKYLSENWTGTPIDILNVLECPYEDRIWVITRNEFITDRDLRLFAVWCARTLKKVNENEILTNTVNIAERFANREASIEDLKAALGAAWGAACEAAWGAAWEAARGAAREAACGAARGAAWEAACGAARGAQIEKLKEIILSYEQ